MTTSPGALSWAELASRLEDEIDSDLRTRVDPDWLEDAVTVELCRKIRQTMHGATLPGHGGRRQVAASVFKARGRLENRFGDLALVFDFRHADGSRYEGAAFFEAKLRDFGGDKIAAFKLSQAMRLHSGLRHAKLLVYDTAPVPGAFTGSCVSGIGVDRQLLYGPDVRASRATVMPMGAVLAAGSDDVRDLYRYSTPFAHHVIFRNLQGIDLDDDEGVVNAAKGYSRLPPATVIAFTVEDGSDDPPLPPAQLGADLELLIDDFQKPHRG